MCANVIAHNERNTTEHTMTQHNAPSKTVVVHIRIPSETKDVLEGLAANDHRTLTSMVNKIIAEYLEVANAVSEGGSNASGA
jgi:hypothetical protein